MYISDENQITYILSKNGIFQSVAGHSMGFHDSPSPIIVNMF